MTAIARRDKLTRTGRARVTVRSPEGLHLTFKLTARKSWVDRDGNERQGHGYWLEVKRFGEWESCGIAHVNGVLQDTATATTDKASLYGAHVLLKALLADDPHPVVRGRAYDVMVEDRCGACGLELTDPTSIERGYGPVCFDRLMEGVA